MSIIEAKLKSEKSRESIKSMVQTYARYKDSGVEWLGEIPEHWEVERGKWLFIKNERPVRDEDEIITCFRDGEVTLRSNRKSSGFTVALKEHGYQGIRKGDLVIHAMDAFAGAIGVSDSDGKSTPVYSACTERNPGTINQYYYSYFLRSLALNGIILALAKGIRERSTDFRFSDFGELLLSFPPLSEQTAIANFLDDKTQKMDQAIGIKEQQIALLKERKQILIHKAVTRGLDDSVPLKDSGVEWIGEIPEHWEVKKVTHLFDEIGSGTTPTAGDIRYYDGEYNFLQTGDLNDGKIIFTKRSLKEKAFKVFTSLKLYPKGSLVMAMYGATIGKLGILDIESATNQACCVFGATNKIEMEYFFQILWAFRPQIISFGYGGGQPNISQDLIKSLRFPVAPLSEQKEISSFIESSSQKIDTVISLKTQEIEKLKEYKSSLINSVVTGKVKVS